jgi:hypothetical protein
MGSFLPLWNELEMKFSLDIFTENNFCLFNYVTTITGGYADFDWFRTKPE